MTIFVEENEKDGMLKGVYIKEKLDENESKIITAKRGKLIKNDTYNCTNKPKINYKNKEENKQGKNRRKQKQRKQKQRRKQNQRRKENQRRKPRAI